MTKKIDQILIGTNNIGKYRELCSLLPKKVKKYSLQKFKIVSPKENGKNFKENSIIKASYFAKKTNLICLSDDSGLEIKLLNGKPGIYSARWAGAKSNFNYAIKKVYKKMYNKKKNWKDHNNFARFVCCLTIFWPNGKNFSSQGAIEGKIANKKKGKKGFGYDPIFIPKGYSKTFGEMSPKSKMMIDHRFRAFKNIKKFFY